MRAIGRDISELFGFSPDDMSEEVINYWRAKLCPFRGGACTKFNHDRSVIYGVCSVTNGAKNGLGDEVIICPKRLYADSFLTLKDAASVAWPEEDYYFIADGDINDLIEKAQEVERSAVAFGQGSGNELSVSTANGKLSMDWVIQRYECNGGLKPLDFIGIEVQSIDITGNYRDVHSAYSSLKNGVRPIEIPNSGHGLNWANVHKRLIPQIIRKGNIYREMERCSGFFFILPDVVFIKFEEVLGELPEKLGPSKSNLSILTYCLDGREEHGRKRKLVRKRIKHFALDDIITAFSSNAGEGPALELDNSLLSLL
ncbi:NotI family restriction endonuclease [Vibrio splendidus]